VITRTRPAHIRLFAALGAALVLAPLSVSATNPATAAPTTSSDAVTGRAHGIVTGSTPGEHRGAVARIRAATHRYHDVAVAEADGFEATGPCVEVPGVGAMGIHYLNHDRLEDGVIDPRRPELLLYLPTDDGLELVGVEYLQVDADQDVATDDDKPWLFGVPFDGPMEGHGPGEPVHYDLHAWVWAHNPAGLFAPFNPALSCGPGSDLPAHDTEH
jgi:hypothetical protein